MAITERAKYETILVARTGKLMVAADLDGTTVNGTNTDLNDPLGAAIRDAGGAVSDISSVVDADIASITASVDQFIDTAELRVLESIEGNLDDVDTTAGTQSRRFSQLAAQVAKRIDRKEKQLEKKYGVGLQELEAGVILLDIADHNDELPTTESGS